MSKKIFKKTELAVSSRQLSRRCGAWKSPAHLAGRRRGAVSGAGVPEAGRPQMWSHLSWGLGGVVIGAALWHLVGFWQFIDTAMHAPADPAHFVAGLVGAPAGPAGKSGKPALNPHPGVAIATCVEVVKHSGNGPAAYRGCQLGLKMTQVPPRKARSDLKLVTARR